MSDFTDALYDESVHGDLAYTYKRFGTDTLVLGTTHLTGADRLDLATDESSPYLEAHPRGVSPGSVVSFSLTSPHASFLKRTIDDIYNNILFFEEVDKISGYGFGEAITISGSFIMPDFGASIRLVGWLFTDGTTSDVITYELALGNVSGGTTDDVAPVLLSTSPAANATDVPPGADIELTFDEPIKAGTGKIEVRQSPDGSLMTSIDVTDTVRVNFSGNAATINPMMDLSPHTGYYVIVPAGAIVDLAGNKHGGIISPTALKFTTGDATDPLPIASFAPGSHTILEGDPGDNPILTIEVQLDKAPQDNAFMKYHVDDILAKLGVDYELVNPITPGGHEGVLQFPKGSTKQFIEIRILSNSTPEPDKTFSVVLESSHHIRLPNDVTTQPVTVTIRDDDDPLTNLPSSLPPQGQFLASPDNEPGQHVRWDSPQFVVDEEGDFYEAESGVRIGEPGEGLIGFRRRIADEVGKKVYTFVVDKTKEALEPLARDISEEAKDLYNIVSKFIFGSMDAINNLDFFDPNSEEFDLGQAERVETLKEEVDDKVEETFLPENGKDFLSEEAHAVTSSLRFWQQNSDVSFVIDIDTAKRKAPLIASAGHKDFMLGSAGNDYLDGGDLADFLYGGGGNDTLIGGGGRDLLLGGAGKDLLEGGAGADLLDGGPGNDTASYASSNAGVSVNLATGVGSGGHARGDTLISIENLIGSRFNDTLVGNREPNRLQGGAGDDVLVGGGGNDRLLGGPGGDVLRGGGGNDVLVGGGGNDVLRGGGGDDELIGGPGNDRLIGGSGKDVLVAGPGRDVLIGGLGADRFVYTKAAHIGTGANRDVVRDFKPGTDLLDLARIDANTQLSGNQAFSFIGAAAFTQAGQLRYENGILSGDVNGDGQADFELGFANSALLSSDDILL